MITFCDDHKHRMKDLTQNQRPLQGQRDPGQEIVDVLRAYVHREDHHAQEGGKRRERGGRANRKGLDTGHWPVAVTALRFCPYPAPFREEPFLLGGSGVQTGLAPIGPLPIRLGQKADVTQMQLSGGVRRSPPFLPH